MGKYLTTKNIVIFVIGAAAGIFAQRKGVLPF